LFQPKRVDEKNKIKNETASLCIPSIHYLKNTEESQDDINFQKQEKNYKRKVARTHSRISIIPENPSKPRSMIQKQQQQQNQTRIKLK